jgi:hypothetical protein
VSDLLTQSMSNFVTEPSFDDQNGGVTNALIENQPVITLSHG